MTDELDRFADRYMTMLVTARSYGARNSALPGSGKLQTREHERFIKTCHRGYEKAQRSAIEELCAVRGQLGHPHGLYFESLLRKLMDYVAYVIVQTKDHVFRRLWYLLGPPNVDRATLMNALAAAEKLNQEDRLTFALVADATMSVHIADVLRVDRRGGQFQFELIELKTGRINTMLLETLQEYMPTPEDLLRMQADRSVDQRYQKQAERIMRQKIRLAQVKEVIESDHGTDIRTGEEIELEGKVHALGNYDLVVERLCGESIAGGACAVTVDGCMHLGCAYSENPEKAQTAALDAAIDGLAMSRVRASPDQLKTAAMIDDLIGGENAFRSHEVFLAAVYSIGARPFPMWDISREHLSLILARKLSLYVIFDLAMFIDLGHQIGIEMSLSSKRATGQAASRMGRDYIVEWGGRMLEFRTARGRSGMLSGMLQRFVVNLTRPSHYLMMLAEEDSSRPMGLEGI
ncbi:MAG: hypothetical protein IH621_01495 [Krumholzibacteria bacterium]|nr:hypothetical protein [Candidatus Krumholzibacteria bacterium]